MKEATASGGGAAAGANDPRQPTTARPYAPPKLSSQDLPVVFGVVGVMLHYKACSWIAIIFCAQSLANMKNFENDLKQLSMAFMFAVMGLVTNYFGPRPGGTKR
uniref:Predicted protein n=1 Tax=Hordeum vulgare subsp. vulgare TaxID=112509 RepID=F2DGH9_HORVV|nr:predicted protein [Hordeum vulgare subsp. vulgare]